MRIYRLLFTPIFFALAVVTAILPPPICLVPGPWGFLTSMWLMYVIMGLAHITPWIALLRGERSPPTEY